MTARAAGAGARALAGLAGLGLALTGCGPIRALVSPPPETTPSERAGWVGYTVAGLRFEAPATWSARGGARKVALDAEGAAQLEAWVVEGRFEDGKACLAAAEEAFQRGEPQLTRVRRHPTSLGGKAALVQEADAGGWHGWAYAVCDGAVQYRLFFTGRSPIAPALLEAWRDVSRSVRLGGGA